MPFLTECIRGAAVYIDSIRGAAVYIDSIRGAAVYIDSIRRVCGVCPCACQGDKLNTCLCTWHGEELNAVVVRGVYVCVYIYIPNPVCMRWRRHGSDGVHAMAVSSIRRVRGVRRVNGMVAMVCMRWRSDQ